MIELSNKQFEQIVIKAIDSIPERYAARMDNVAFIVESHPTPQQAQRLKLRGGDLLFGLYEGTPLPQRGGITKLLPDKITLFKKSLELISSDLADLTKRVQHTVWHEVAHFYGLDHIKINELEDSSGK